MSFLHERRFHAERIGRAPAPVVEPFHAECGVCKGTCVEIFSNAVRAPRNEAGVQGIAEVIGERPNPDFAWPRNPHPTLYTIRKVCSGCGGKGTVRSYRAVLS